MRRPPTVSRIWPRSSALTWPMSHRARREPRHDEPPSAPVFSPGSGCRADAAPERTRPRLPARHGIARGCVGLTIANVAAVAAAGRPDVFAASTSASAAASAALRWRSARIAATTASPTSDNGRAARLVLQHRIRRCEWATVRSGHSRCHPEPGCRERGGDHFAVGGDAGATRAVNAA